MGSKEIQDLLLTIDSLDLTDTQKKLLSKAILTVKEGFLVWSHNSQGYTGIKLQFCIRYENHEEQNYYYLTVKVKTNSHQRNLYFCKVGSGYGIKHKFVLENPTDLVKEIVEKVLQNYASKIKINDLMIVNTTKIKTMLEG